MACCLSAESSADAKDGEIEEEYFVTPGVGCVRYDCFYRTDQGVLFVDERFALQSLLLN